ncbi:MAG: dTDP-4-dehydrorhamnose reductase [Lachnospiraceae bacterium]|nr:dTDP-4-dehydrorhamnose reductase [Lachnospiraceae bacterium]
MNGLSVWIAGAKGQLGSAIYEILQSEEGVRVLTTDLDVDVARLEDVISFADENRPDVVLNCAGMTDLAKCERNEEKAYRVNALGARNLSVAARRIEAKLIHISTDDVFDGTAKCPLTEFDRVNPLTVYGKSKLAGETFVRELAPRHMIVRSSWIYGKTKNNFVSYILEELLTEDTIYVPVDQISTPTSAVDLAKFIVKLIDSNEYGIYHASCEGMCSRYEFAKEIVRLSGKKVTIEPHAAGENPSVVNRPRYTLLDNFMMRVSGIYQMPDWKESLATFMEKRIKAD